MTDITSKPDGVHAMVPAAAMSEAAFSPAFEEKVLEDRGEHELVQDFAGRHVLCFKGRRSGFMPEYVDHPVKNMKTWQELCKWRLDPQTPARYEKLDKRILAQGKKEIDAMVDRIFPVMQARGGYIPTCDHGVPEEVPYENYIHYRKRALEFA